MEDDTEEDTQYVRPSECDRVDPDATLDSLLERRGVISGKLFELGDAIDSIRFQRENKASADPAWARRAAAALHHFKRHFQEHERAVVNITMAVSRLEKQDSARQFVRAAKELLPVETFNAVWAAVGESAVAARSSPATITAGIANR
jgi:hypothetical protein